ncbi:FMN-dependent NADH-azoreductase [Kitasatospora sp. MAA19]|uniref:FMN-dependent NADH-azoreductase n=1 Tax=Kitasatospora sp. MAA19 TaxID=3035090 RepID=UPI0024743B88|nr:NAD(P)H-dependent oxidoreductase [Kitasatospora sp. MAA19]MDH6704668.1 FMN-dependent NADH-azoreductase [Kitasatospora sp. MAA19]
MTTTTLLHLDSSISLGDSVSRALTARFAAAWRARHGAAGRYVHRDLIAEPVAPIGAGYAALGRRVERKGTVPVADVAALAEGPDEEREWSLTHPLINRLLAADTVLLGVPMYNFAVPAALKAWIDRIGFPGSYTDPATGESLLRRTRVVIAAARGGGYGPGTPREGFDFQIPYLRAYFTNLGVPPERLHIVAAELTRADDVPALAGLQPLAVKSLADAEAALDALAAGRPTAG